VVAGFLGGRVENFFMRTMDIILAFPAILLGAVLVAIMGPGLIQAAIAVSIRQVPEFARLAHGSTMSVKESSFVEASRAVGSPEIRIMIEDIFPNISSVLLTQAALAIATACLSIAALGFLGLGAQPPTPELGSMISTGRGYLSNAPHISVFPGLALLLFVLGANLLGDGLNDYFATKVELGE
jgi:peptide/nickel transport system permease protein